VLFQQIPVGSRRLVVVQAALEVLPGTVDEAGSDLQEGEQLVLDLGD
jgi:hypothetical protein